MPPNPKSRAVTESTAKPPTSCFCQSVYIRDGLEAVAGAALVTVMTMATYEQPLATIAVFLYGSTPSPGPENAAIWIAWLLTIGGLTVPGCAQCTFHPFWPARLPLAK